ncbi:hypothetical protein BOTBODRAFT_50557 [Botryobasidium botryosum FD-172 SS1]|uniref:Alpha-MPP n=1 Tax=Botryobasidium botryosum (strain FD-172 SS1) TaxID=930990 RepID=A0A067N0H9_BOTB1|nr:hypothetical protein BOTBODRAFT_50557 [Botryobasidium botryosum FD-172 SS1]
MKRALNVAASRAKPALAHARRHAVRTAATAPPVDPVQITTLPNKLRVATEASPGHFSSLGVYIEAGSRFESPRMSGVSHLLDRMAFKSTQTRTPEEMSNVIDSIGGQILCSSSRETIMYQSSHFHSATPTAMSVLADASMRSLFLPEEVAAQQDAAAYEIREISSKPEMILPEILHQVAYERNTLGNPLLCPEDRLPLINGKLMDEFVKTWYRPDRIVVAGVGMPHEELVELAHKHFGDLQVPPIPLETPPPTPRAVPTHLLASSKHTSSPSLYKSLTTAASSFLNPHPISVPPEPSYTELATAKAQYTGGQLFLPRTDLEFNHVYVAFEGMSIHDEDIYALATMQVLLGGGGSFSAGGPGKGMYSRLYTHVLNHQPRIDHCASFHHIYNDSSLFGLFASAHPSMSTSSILPILLHQLSLLLHNPIPLQELSRAKNQLSSSLMMALESRSVEVEDLGRQILVHGRKVGVAEMCGKVASVTAADIRRVAGRVFGAAAGGPPTIVVMGKEDVGDWSRAFKKFGVGRSA